MISYEDALRNADSKNELRLRVKLESKRENKPIEGDGDLMIVDDEARPGPVTDRQPFVSNLADSKTTDSGSQPMLNTKPLFKLMVERRASDLFFTCNAPIKIKIEGQIMPVNKQVLSPDEVRAAAFGMMTPEQNEYFKRELEIDFAISEPGLGRFRVAVFYQRGYPAMVLRYITADMPKLDQLGLPDILRDLTVLRAD